LPDVGRFLPGCRAVAFELKLIWQHLVPHGVNQMGLGTTRRKYTVPQLAHLWGVSPAKVTRFIRSGQLRAIDLATPGATRPRYAIDVNDIAAFEAARQIVPGRDVAASRRLRRRSSAAVKEFF
jgi:hypothetical protein